MIYTWNEKQLGDDRGGDAHGGQIKGYAWNSATKVCSITLVNDGKIAVASGVLHIYAGGTLVFFWDWSLHA